ncbi:hypothetical protein P691DRAFT_696013 [Macrolepiota fuliginosa MF-IS2]|uniref:G-patch domain-containing protein n=1 Tax=Macrolepiota fuliginosa MF-IS2 TaxID=1400762 RepID=A0A9P5XM24_9AGAR|nr:hypothetical protein P691DRAFT_696013 [Macrolepiota fuliginosa MF-IS2]
MATTSFTIYSHYDPEKDKERLQRETGQILDGDEAEQPSAEELWREAASAQFLRAQRPPPKFVPATISYEVGSSEPGPSKPKIPEESPLGNTLSSWYRSLTNANDSSHPAHQPRPSSTPIPIASSSAYPRKAKEPRTVAVTKDKNNWFIQKVLQSEPPSPLPTPLPTLADILAREPPPLPSEPKYTPPVWVEIGPSNKGFAILQKGGWNEGEALGAGAGGRPTQTLLSGIHEMRFAGKGKQKAVARGETTNRASRVVKQEFGDDLGDVKKEADVIDLTQSDSETSSEEVEEVGTNERPRTHDGSEVTTSDNSDGISAYGRKALLTPIATVLKLDRLGIGLKAKTEGPYKASVKRVTHNAAALAAHRKAADEARRRRETFGRGSRGYGRQKRREEEKRRDLMAYMNT